MSEEKMIVLRNNAGAGIGVARSRFAGRARNSSEYLQAK
jgi:hypothetical protein